MIQQLSFYIGTTLYRCVFFNVYPSGTCVVVPRCRSPLPGANDLSHCNSLSKAYCTSFIIFRSTKDPSLPGIDFSEPTNSQFNSGTESAFIVELIQLAMHVSGKCKARNQSQHSTDRRVGRKNQKQPKTKQKTAKSTGQSRCLPHEYPIYSPQSAMHYRNLTKWIESFANTNLNPAPKKHRLCWETARIQSKFLSNMLIASPTRKQVWS